MAYRSYRRRTSPLSGAFLIYDIIFGVFFGRWLSLALRGVRAAIYSASRDRR